MKNQTIYPETFNARYMTFEEIANSFILPNNFWDLLRNENAILAGSRGCGKTTLLKMLHPKALYNWKGNEAERVRETIPFIGIYIPTDRQWSSQFKVVSEIYPLNNDFVQQIFSGVVNANILIAVCSTFSSLIEIYELDKKFEVSLTTLLIDNWKIPKPIIPSFSAITLKLLSMVNEFNIYLQRGDFNSHLPDICFSEFINLVSIAIVSFENAIETIQQDFLKKEYKWALCFDELEIAPQWVYEKIMNQDLRSRDQRILFKITATPELKEIKSRTLAISPREFDDFKIQRLWVYDRNSQDDWRKYCKSYLKNYLNKTYNVSIDPTPLFGHHDYNSALKAADTNIFSMNYGKDELQFSSNGIMYKTMLMLQSYDKSFYKFLLKKNIDPLNPLPISSTQEAAIHRKIKPIVLYRYYFTELDKKEINGIKLRSRNVNSFNHGMDYIFDIADGNQRAYVNLITAFYKLIKFDKKKHCKQIMINDQARIIENFSNYYFYPRIENYPDNLIKYKNRNFTLIEIINYIGNYFFSRLVLQNFSADPVIFFYFDRYCPKEFKLFIELALESGAILKLEEEIVKRGVRKETNVYRLTYSLYPKFKLPKIDYNPIALSTIIQPLIDSKIKFDNQTQLDFLDED